MVLSHFFSLLLLSSYAQYKKWTKWTFIDFYDLYGFCFIGDEYLLTKGIQWYCHIFVLFYSCLVTIGIINGQNGHLLTFMIHMASFCLGLDTCWQKYSLVLTYFCSLNSCLVTINTINGQNGHNYTAFYDSYDFCLLGIRYNFW